MKKRTITLAIHDSTVLPFAGMSPAYSFGLGAMLALGAVYGGEAVKTGKGMVMKWPDGTEKPVMEILGVLGIIDRPTEEETP